MKIFISCHKNISKESSSSAKKKTILENTQHTLGKRIIMKYFCVECAIKNRARLALETAPKDDEKICLLQRKKKLLRSQRREKFVFDFYFSPLCHG